MLQTLPPTEERREAVRLARAEDDRRTQAAVREARAAEMQKMRAANKQFDQIEMTLHEGDQMPQIEFVIQEVRAP